MSLPESSTSDLHVMGITPDMIRAELEKINGPIDGDTVGFFLPGDGYEGSQTRRARNYLRSDWTDVEHRPKMVITQNVYEQKFENFDDDQPKSFQFSNSVSITTGNDYSQTRSFDVGVNANIPLGQSGAMIGFTATMSATDVANRSESKTTSKAIAFAVDVDAKSGKKVTETTTEYSTDTVWQAQIGVEGSVGIEIDPGWWKPNYHWWFYNIEAVFPNAVASSRILRSRLDTSVDTVISKLSPPQSDDRDIDEALEFRQHENTASDEMTPSMQNVGSSVATDDFMQPPAMAVLSDHVKIDFTHQGQPVPVNTREPKVKAWKQKILIGVRPLGAIAGFLGPTQWTPNATAADVGTYTVPYESTKITRPQLRAQVIEFARQITWGGLFLITFF